jgi:hypothetical protein
MDTHGSRFGDEALRTGLVALLDVETLILSMEMGLDNSVDGL